MGNMLNTFGLLSSLYITLFGALFLFAASNKQYRNRYYLSLFFFNGFILFAGHVFSFFEYWKAFRYFDFAFLASLLMFYPLYFRYLNSAFGYKISSVKWPFHYAPAMVIGTLMLVSSYSFDWETYQSYMNNNLYGLPLDGLNSLILSVLYKGARAIHIVQILFYNSVSLIYILRTRKNIQNSFSNLDRFQLRYFYAVNFVFLIFMAIPGIYVTIIGRTPLTENNYLLGTVAFLFTFLYLILGMVGLRQKAFTESEIQKNEEVQILPNKEDKEYRVLKAELLKYFAELSPWQNPNLNIWDVSKALASNRTYISQLINKEFQCNFNTFVNNYRIEEAKMLLQNGKHSNSSLAHIAELAGFGSTSSFVRVFKQRTGKTPVKYKEEG